MRIIVIGDSPICMRLVSHYYSERAYDSVVHVKDPSENILRTIISLQPEAIVNCSFTDVDDSSAFVENARDPATYALYARMVGAAYYHMSDSSVFNIPGPREYDKPYPVRVYGLSRLLGERAVHALYPEATVIRTSWLYGAEIPESPPMVAASSVAGQRRTAHIYHDVTVSPTFIGDAAKMIAINIGADAVEPSHERRIVHLAPEMSATWYDFLLPEYPDILPLRARKMLNSKPINRNVSITPSQGWTIPSGGLGRFVVEVDGYFAEGKE